MTAEIFQKINIDLEDKDKVLTINNYSIKLRIDYQSCEDYFFKFLEKYSNKYYGIFFIIYENFESEYILEENINDEIKEKINSIALLGLYQKGSNKENIELEFNDNYFKINDKIELKTVNNIKKDNIEIKKNPKANLFNFFKK